MSAAIAVVVPVLDEVGNIAALLGDLRAQQRAAAEVVVADAGSRDGTAELVEEVALAWPALRLVRAPGATPGRGRNAAVRATASPLVATVDAGSRVGPGWLASLAAGVTPEGRTATVGVAEAEAASSFERAAGWFTLRAFKPPGEPGPVGRSFLPAGRNGVCFPRAAWEAAGGYPDDLPWGEDKRFVQALRGAGFELEVRPGAVVRWRPRSTPVELYGQYMRYARGDVRGRVDRQNSLVPLALLTAGAALAARAATGDRSAGVALGAAATAYLGIFTAAAARELDDPRAIAWVPGIRLLVDVAKVHGLVAELTNPGIQTAPPPADHYGNEIMT
jgi:glycosyltransferase involved in cell wall biosynthesis